MLRTREITDIFRTFDEIYLVFTSKSKYSLFIILSNGACVSICIHSVLASAETEKSCRFGKSYRLGVRLVYPNRKHDSKS